MKPDKQLPLLPTGTAGRLHDRRKSRPQLVLKPESPWATRIRELLNLKQGGAQYVPYLPVRRTRSLIKSIRRMVRPETRGGGKQGDASR